MALHSVYKLNMNDIEEIIEPLSQIKEPLFWQGPASESSIGQVETLLGFSLPPSFRSFLLRYGGGGVVGEEISGIEANDSNLDYKGTVLGDTRRCRKDFGLPHHLCVIYFSDDGICWCLDCSEADERMEYPVVSYSIFKREIEKEIAPTFKRFLKQYVELRVQRGLADGS